MLQHWGIITGTPPPGHHHQGITTRAPPLALVLHVPKAFAGAHADPLQLPSSWLGRRRALPVGYRGSPACNRAWCDLGHQSFCPRCWHRLLMVSQVTPPSSSSQVPHLRISKRWTNLIVLGAVFGFLWHTENPLLYWVICTNCNICSSEDTRDSAQPM